MILGLSVLITFIAILSLWLYHSKQRRNVVPGMKRSSKQQGNLDDIKAAGGFYDFLAQLHAKYGPIASFWYGEEYTVSIASPELFKQHTQPFDRPPLFFKMFEAMIGSRSIEMVNGEEGKERRKIYDRIFERSRLRFFYSIFQKSADVLLKEWSTKDPDDHIPLCDEMFKFTVRVALCSTLGEYFEDEEIVDAFRKAYSKAQEELSKVLANPDHFEKAYKMQQFNEALDYMNSIVKKGVKRRKETTNLGKGNLIIDDILKNIAEDDVILQDSITFLIGSFHNMKNVLFYSMYYMAKDEEIQEKVYNEIKEVLGDDAYLDDLNVDKLKYMRQVIDESLRFGTSGGFHARSQETEAELGGYTIPKSVPVIQAFGLVQKDERYWSSPEKFDPERFNEKNTKERHPFAFVPFGFSGKRKCPAWRYSYLEASVFLASVLQRFKIQLHGDQRIKIVHDFSTHPAEEVWVKVVKR